MGYTAVSMIGDIGKASRAALDNAALLVLVVLCCLHWLLVFDLVDHALNQRGD